MSSWTRAPLGNDRPERRPPAPRRVSNGIRLRAKEGVAPSTPLAAGWYRRLEMMIEPERLIEGEQYARSGQTVSLEITSGAIEARVQGRAAKPYRARIELPVFPDAQWDLLVESMAREAIYVTRIMSSELPAGVEEMFAGHGATLIPERSEDFRFTCTCRAAGPCKHAAAIVCLMTERLESSPLCLFTLRGLEEGQVLDRLRQARAIQAHGVASAHVDPLIPESESAPLPLEACIDDFWRLGAPPASLLEFALPRHVPHALLRRLGPSPLNGRFPLVGLLASIYDTVGASASEMQDRVECPPETE